MRIRIINKGKVLKEEVSLVRRTLKEVMNSSGIGNYGFPSNSYTVVLQRGKGGWHGRGHLSRPWISLTLPKPPYCYAEFKFLIWHEYMHTLNLQHKDMSKECMDWPCSCMRTKRRIEKPEPKVKTHKVLSYYDNKDFIKRLRAFCADLPYTVTIRGAWSEELDIFIASEHAGKISRVCILLPKDPSYDDFLEIEDRIVNLQAQTGEEKL